MNIMNLWPFNRTITMRFFGGWKDGKTEQFQTKYLRGTNKYRMGRVVAVTLYDEHQQAHYTHITEWATYERRGNDWYLIPTKAEHD